MRGKLRSDFREPLCGLLRDADHPGSRLASIATSAFTGTDCGLLRRFHGTPPPQSESFASKIFRHFPMTLAFKTTFEVFTRVSPNNSLERLTECSVGLVTDQASNVHVLFVTLL
jgi:hypothetical protein